LLAQVRFDEQRGGYDPDEVDEFLRRIGDAVSDFQARLEGAEGTMVRFGGEHEDFTAQLMTVRFSTARQGYDPDQVDNFLANVAERLGLLQAKVLGVSQSSSRAGVATASLFRVVLPVGNIEEATRFYGQVLEVGGQRVSPGRHYFDCGGVILVCFDCRADGDADRPQRPNPDHLYFSLTNLDDGFERVTAAGPSWIEEEIRTRPWGERSFYCGDPWGNPLCFVEQSTTFTGGTW
jgi:DivIVA domain-containing protein